MLLIGCMARNLPMYMMSFFSLPKEVLKKLDYFRSRFYWQGDEQKKNIDLLSGPSCACLRTKVDLVIHNVPRWLSSWVILQRPDLQEQVVEGSQLLVQTAKSLSGSERKFSDALD
ncbi:hypothetical protein U9M48_030134 [Paspalum notatum var. saurae]|uniref:Uncharacterized protein n=1 Tax=Paspalum notatum var. saurae TaxID=547442 RepID=A0AAQ3X2Z3_PASNO